MATLTASEALYYKLKTTSGVTDLIGLKIFPLIAPKNKKLPWITYQQISNVPVHAMGSDAAVYGPRIQVDIFAETFDSLEDIGLQVKTALQDYSGTIGSGDTLAVSRIFLENEADRVEVDPESKETTYHRIMDFIMWHG